MKWSFQLLNRDRAAVWTGSLGSLAGVSTSQGCQWEQWRNTKQRYLLHSSGGCQGPSRQKPEAHGYWTEDGSDPRIHYLYPHVFHLYKFRAKSQKRRMDKVTRAILIRAVGFCSVTTRHTDRWGANTAEASHKPACGSQKKHQLGVIACIGIKRTERIYGERGQQVVDSEGGRWEFVGKPREGNLLEWCIQLSNLITSLQVTPRDTHDLSILLLVNHASIENEKKARRE